MQSNDCCSVVDAPFAAADDVAVHRVISMPAECSCPKRGADEISLLLPFLEAMLPKDEALVSVFKNEVAKNATVDWL